MNKTLLLFVISLHILVLISSKEEKISLNIERAKSHSDQTGNLTPLVVSLTSQDTKIKIKPVDLICIVDVSGSMSGDKIKLVRESLKYLVNLMKEEDNFALVEFESKAKVVNNFTKMAEENKTLLMKNIDNLKAYGGTNILDGLKKALDLITDDYSSGERIASLILLSDGQDNYYYNMVDDYFLDYIEDTGKENYIFTLHTFGYGNDHDAKLMESIANVKNGGFFFIQRLTDLLNAYLQIYGSLSTVFAVNVHLTIQSNFSIVDVYGKEDLYNSTLNNSTKPNTFTTTLLHVISGKTINYVVLVDVPSNTPYGTEVLRATISPQGITKRYLWDETFNVIAYEEYIKCITIIYFSNGYYAGRYKGIQIITEGKTWIVLNYIGTRNWVIEYEDAINDLQNYYSFGSANLLSKIHELKTSSIGNHYSEYNSYTIGIIYKSHNIDVSTLPIKKVKGEIIIDFEERINYYYFYLKDGKGTINNLLFSGERSSLIIYSDNSNSKINIKSTSEYLEYYYWNETKARLQNIIDFSHEGKFIFEKNFPIEFYSIVDGTKDITFNIEFLKLDYDGSSDKINHSFNISAYIVDDLDIESLNNEIDSMPSSLVFNGSYDNELSIGKIVIKKENIYKQLSSTRNNYLYVIIKNINSKIIYKQIEGQLLFFSMDNIFSTVPEGFLIVSNILEGQKTPHLYTLSGKNITIEFSNPGSELDCKIIKHQNYPIGSEELYVDYEQFEINRNEDNNKTYIDVIQPYDENTTSDNIIISIFSKNESHIPDSNKTNSYAFKYTVNPYIPKIDDFTENLTDNYTENYTDNNSTDNSTEDNAGNSTEPVDDTTEVVSQNLIDIRPKANVIFLGFAKFIYIRTVKIITFSMNFVHFTQMVYSEILVITMRIRYKVSLRGLQENETKKVECELIKSRFDNQDKYNCSLETNGEEIDNIQVDRNFEFKNQKIEVKAFSPFASKYMNNLQNVGDIDIFDKKIYVLDEATSVVDNENNTFNITGIIVDKNSNYNDLVLLINSIEENNNPYNISCKVLNNSENNYTFSCYSNNEMRADLKGAFSELGSENLIVNYKDNPSDSVSFASRIGNGSSPISSKFGTPVIIAIIASIVAILIIVITLIICLRKKGQKDNETKGTEINQISATNNNVNSNSSNTI